MKKMQVTESKYISEYMGYLGRAKTERLSFLESVKILERAGFKDISKFATLKSGDKVYRGYEDRTIMAAVIGKRKISDSGLKVVGGHTDAPRLDLKPRPLLEKDKVVYFDCHIYGGIKKYQWLTLPLALYGTVVLKSGKKVQISVGDNDGDPVFMISDILPHLGKDQAKKNRDEFFSAEDLDAVCWSTPAADEKGKSKDGLVKYLKDAYGIEEEDLLSAELELVPAGMPRFVGFDRKLITGYGHDDRVCSFAALKALVDAAAVAPEITAAILMCDKEEIGSMGSTGMQSSFFENTVAEFIERQEKSPRDIMIRRALEKSSMLSADVTAAADPHFPEVDSTGNSALLHGGVAASKYTGGTSKGGASDCGPEFIAEIRSIMAKDSVKWQMAELGKMEKGGGGTISQYMARFGMKVLDMGTPMWNMHAPWEIVSAQDAYQTYRAYSAYLRS